jgi:hypothetical protein
MDGCCVVEKNDQGHDICVITGLCVKMLNFSSEEFVDTACMGGTELLGGCEGGGMHALSMREMFEDENDGYSNCPSDGADLLKMSARFHQLSSDNYDGRENRGAFCKKARTMNRNTPPRNPASDDQNKGMGHADVHHMDRMASSFSPASTVRCSVNKKNRYRSWVYQRVMQPKLIARRSQQQQMPCARQNNVISERDFRTCAANESLQLQWSLLGRSAVGEAASAKHLQHSLSNNHINQSSPKQDTPSVSSHDLFSCAHGLHHQHQNHVSSSNLMKSDKVHNLIQIYVSEVLCSSKWEKSMQMEVFVAPSLLSACL